MVTFDDFSKLDLRIGRVLEVNPHPDADKLYLVKVDIGQAQVQLVAGVKLFYQPEELVNKLVIVLTNLEQKSIRGVVSEGMLLAAHGNGDLGVVTCDKDIAPGSKVK